MVNDKVNGVVNMVVNGGEYKALQGYYFRAATSMDSYRIGLNISLISVAEKST